MRVIAFEIIEKKVDELLVCLDKDILNLQESLAMLNQLRALLVKRDDASLSKMLVSIREKIGSYTDHKSKRQSILRELAKALNCNVENVKLTMLEKILPEEKKSQLSKRKIKLKSLVVELKKEHLSTALLLSECNRFNRLLLKSVFGLGSEKTVYYNSDGTTKRQNDAAFMNVWS